MVTRKEGWFHVRFSTLVIPDLPVRAFRLFDASLATRELLVHAGGKVVAMSEGMRRQGLRQGWSIERAQAQAFPGEAVALPFQASTTRLAREAMLADLNRMTPWIELLDPLPHRDPLLDLRAVAVLLDEQEAPRLTAHLQSQTGIASDRSTSLLAALQNAPGEVRAVPEGGEAAFRETLSLAVLREAGVAEETLERLHWLGFESVGLLARLTPRQVQAQFADGALLCRLMEASDRRPVALFHPPPGVTVRHDLLEPACEPAEYEPVLWHLVRSAVTGLEGREASMISVTVHQALEGHSRPSSARRFPHEPTADPREIRTLARLALEEARLGGEEPRDEKAPAIESVSLILEGLARPRPEQACLWPERTRHLRQALERMEKQMPGALLRFVPQDVASTLPEEAFRLVSALHSVPLAKGRGNDPAPRKGKAPQAPAALPSPAPKTRRALRRSTCHGTRHDGSTATGWEDFHETLPGAD